MKSKILVQTKNKTRFNPSHSEGLQEMTTKKEFMEYVGKLWDTVNTFPEIVASIQLTNMKDRC